MQSAITERFVDSVDGVRIAVYEQGNPDGPTLVMAHGWPDSSLDSPIDSGSSATTIGA